MAARTGEPVRWGCDAILEREREIEAMEDALEGARLTGAGSLLVVEGPAGIGKSRLLAEARARIPAAEMQILRARGSERERNVAFGVALQLFERVAPGAGTARDEVGGPTGLAAAIFERGARGSVTAAEDASLFPLLHGLFWLASTVAARRPLVLVVDDAHAADRQSLCFLLYLAQRLEELPVVVLLAARPSERDGEPDLVAELEAQPIARVLRPAALSDEAVASLVRSAMAPDADDAFCGACAEVTAGNPFLLRELVGALRSDGISPTSASTARVRGLGSRAVARAVLTRVGQLPPEAGALARSLAILGDDARLDDVAALAGMERGAALDAADALVRLDVLRPGEPVSFVHPLVGASVHDDIAPLARGDAHLRAARMLYADGAADERIASHLLNALTSGEPWVVAALQAAAARARRVGAPETAARYLRRALDEPNQRESLPRTLVALAEAEATSGDGGAVAHLEAALPLLAGGEERARILQLLGRVLYRQGLLDRAAQAYEAALEEIEDGSSELGLEVEASYIAVARLAGGALQADGLRRLASFVERAPTTPATPAGRACLAEASVGQIVASNDHLVARELALRAYGDGILLAEETADSQTLYVVAAALTHSDDLAGAERICTAAIEDAHRRGAVLAFSTASYARAAPLYYAGRLTEALADTEQALEGRRYGWQMAVPAVCGYRALALLERGEPGEAAAAIELGEESAGGRAMMLYSLVLHARARLLIGQGKLEDALADLRLCLRQGGGFAGAPGFMPWYSELALVLSLLGEHEEAREFAGEELRLARRFGALRPLGVALRAAGLVARGPDGIDLLEEAVETLERSPARLEHVRALVDLGAAVRRGGRPAQARAPLGRALRLAEPLGAVAIADRAREELVAAGGRPRRAQSSSAELLTPGELRAARLAAEGRTNREIAQALFVTPKAVEWHLGNAYRKLEIGSRRDLASALSVAAATG